MSAARPRLLTPLYGVAVRLGAQFADGGAGWQIPASYGDSAAEASAVRDRLGIADVSADGNLRIEGAAAEAVLGTAYGLRVPEIGESAALGEGRCYRVRTDLFVVTTPPGAEGAVDDAIGSAAQAADQRVTVTVMTHGQANIRIIGARVTELMSKLCGLDFGPAAFPNGAVRRTSFAKTGQLIIRRDLDRLPAFLVIGARSAAPYVWETIMEAGEEYGITPIGRDALAAIASDSIA